jgi:hypothetical protein
MMDMIYTGHFTAWLLRRIFNWPTEEEFLYHWINQKMLEVRKTWLLKIIWNQGLKQFNFFCIYSCLFMFTFQDCLLDHINFRGWITNKVYKILFSKIILILRKSYSLFLVNSMLHCFKIRLGKGLKKNEFTLSLSIFIDIVIVSSNKIVLLLLAQFIFWLWCKEYLGQNLLYIPISSDVYFFWKIDYFTGIFFSR